MKFIFCEPCYSQFYEWIKRPVHVVFKSIPIIVKAQSIGLAGLFILL